MCQVGQFEYISERSNCKQNNGRAKALPFVCFCAKRVCCMRCLLGGHLFLFAFHAHLFEFALFGVVGFLYLGLDLGCRFFELG